MQYPEGHVSKSVYAVFKLVSVPTSCEMLEDFFPNLGIAIWTTTPWTIPANAGNFLLFYWNFFCSKIILVQHMVIIFFPFST